MQVVADVDEADIGGVEEGQRVTFTVDAYPNDVFEGRVTQIDWAVPTAHRVRQPTKVSSLTKSSFRPIIPT